MRTQKFYFMKFYQNLKMAKIISYSNLLNQLNNVILIFPVSTRFQVDHKSYEKHYTSFVVYRFLKKHINISMLLLCVIGDEVYANYTKNLGIVF